MADHNNPVTTQSDANFAAAIRDRFVDLARFLDPATTSPTNLSAESIRWNSAENRFEIYTGSPLDWEVLSTQYKINVEGQIGAASTFEDDDATRSALGADGNLFKKTTYTSGGTHNFDAATVRYRVIVIGAGGGGGGCQAGGGSGTAVTAGGGGSGAIVEGLFDKTASSGTVAVGSGGAGNDGLSGSNGGNSTFTDGTVSITAQGGRGGASSISSSANAAGSASSSRATASGGNIRNTEGSLGNNGLCFVTGGFAISLGGKGADCPGYGSGGEGGNVRASSPSSVANGGAASGYGAGGGGAATAMTTGTRTGGAGTGGLVIIEEYR